MRTRATGYSPGGLRELGSPKRPRSQLPPPVRASRTSKKASESRKEATTKTRNAKLLDPKGENAHPNGHASNHRPNSPNNVNNTELENKLPTTSTDESNSKKLISHQKLENNQSHHLKNIDGNKRDGLAKKPPSNRSLSLKLSRQASFHTQDIDIVHIKTSCRSTKMPSRTQPVVSVLGKRNRKVSSGSNTTQINDTDFSNRKRPRISEKSPTWLESNTAKSLALVPYNVSEKNSGPGQNHLSYPKSSQRIQSGSFREDRAINSNSTHSRYPESPQDSNISSNSTKNCHTPLILNSNTKNLPSSVYAERSNNIETQVKQGMQNIMSRMNKYQYQPVPKNLHDSANLDSFANKEARLETDENYQCTISAISTVKSKGFATTQNSKSRVETKLKKSSQDYDRTSSEEVDFSSKNGEGEQKTSDAKQTRIKMANQKDRRIEVEKLFRSTAPDASYQNILRAVAEWAVHNSSALPTREEIFTYVESSKAPDPTELFTAADRPFLRNSSIRKVKNGALIHRSSNSVKRRLSRKWKESEGSRNPGSIGDNCCSEKYLDSPHEPLSQSNKIKPVKQAVEENPEEFTSENTENCSTLTTQAQNTPSNQSWGFLNTVKTIVSTPFKAFGFGFGFKDNNEAVKEVAKDIDFVFKPPAMPKPSDRVVKTGRVAKKNGGLSQTPARATNITRQNRLQSDCSYRYKTHNNQANFRFTVTEKQRADLRRHQDLKKTQKREKESDDDKDRRRKIPKLHMNEMSNLKLTETSFQPSQTIPQCIAANSVVEEWPPNLDPNRPVVELQQATQELPRGPNGEDVATMLCRGWLISKHRDSFIREVRESKIIPLSSKKKKFEHSFPHLGISQNMEVQMCDLLENAETVKNTDSKCDHTSSRDNQPGRSYGFQYDDESSSDEEDSDGKKSSEVSMLNDSSFKINDPIPSGIDLSKRTLFKSKFEVKCTTNEFTKPSETSRQCTSPIRRLPQSINSSYTPWTPSTLRNVAALASYPSNEITNSTQTCTTEDIIAQKPSDSNSLALINENSSLSQFTGTGRDWSFTFRVDPRMAHFNPDIIAAVEALPKDSLPSIQLPSCLG